MVYGPDWLGESKTLSATQPDISAHRVILREQPHQCRNTGGLFSSSLIPVDAWVTGWNTPNFAFGHMAETSLPVPRNDKTSHHPQGGGISIYKPTGAGKPESVPAVRRTQQSTALFLP